MNEAARTPTSTVRDGTSPAGALETLFADTALPVAAASDEEDAELAPEPTLDELGATMTDEVGRTVAASTG